jgi:hypothetical protein
VVSHAVFIAHASRELDTSAGGETTHRERPQGPPLPCELPRFLASAEHRFLEKEEGIEAIHKDIPKHAVESISVMISVESISVIIPTGSELVGVRTSTCPVPNQDGDSPIWGMYGRCRVPPLWIASGPSPNRQVCGERVAGEGSGGRISGLRLFPIPSRPPSGPSKRLASGKGEVVTGKSVRI